MAASFSTAYLAGDARASALLHPAFRDPEARVRRTRAAAARGAAPGLVDALRLADARLPPSAARRASLDALATPGTACVVTGQQVGLFLGPLYTFYKAASAVACARALEREAGVRVVPVFWLQSEDHDLEEIASCTVPRHGADPAVLRLEGAQATPRASVEHARLGPAIDGTLAALDDALGGLPHAADVMALVRAAYREGATVVDAFARLVASLFADEGLVVIDPRDPGVARLAAPTILRSLAEARAVDAALADRARALESAGFDVQVPVRPGVALAFVHESGAEGPRFRPSMDGDGFRLGGSGDRASLASIAARVERDPRAVSTSALLRPIVQDALLPTAAYLGGPGELAYYAEVAALYPLFGLEPPLLAPRARFRVVDDRARSRLARLGLAAADLEAPRDAILARLAPPDAAVRPTALAADLLGPTLPRLDAFVEEAAALDPNLARRARRTRATIERAVSRLADRYRRDLAARDATAAGRVDRLRASLFPGGGPQERVFGWPSFAAERGVRAFTEAVLAAVVPFDGATKELA
jgi:bacillithiol biosynthesis cysteine-adding enzyme BshC